MSYSKLLQREEDRRIFALSDIHGWYRPLVELFKKAGIIEKIEREMDDFFRIGDDILRYCGGEIFIIITGDYVDADTEGKKVMELIINLEREVLKAGGELIVLSGNHERQLLKQSIRYWDKIEEFYEWIKQRPLAAIVNKILFVHGGTSKKALVMIESAKRDKENFLSAFKRRLEEDEELCWEITNRTFALHDKDTLSSIIQKTSIEYLVIGHAPSYGKYREEIKLVGPEIDGRSRVFNIDADMGDWHIGKGYTKKNGGLLSIRWNDNILETEYIYRDNHI